MDEVDRLLAANFAQVGPPLLDGLAELLTEARSVTKDLETFLVLLTVMLRAYRTPAFAELSGDQLMRGDVEDVAALWTNVRSISDATGMPKETVRRKVNELVAAGLVDRSGNQLSLSAEACRRCRNVTLKLVRMATLGQAAVSKSIGSQEAS